MSDPWLLGRHYRSVEEMPTVGIVDVTCRDCPAGTCRAEHGSQRPLTCYINEFGQEVVMGAVAREPQQFVEVPPDEMGEVGLSLPLKVLIALGLFVAILAALILQSYQQGR